MVRVPIDDRIDEVLGSHSIHFMAKDILRAGRERDCLDAYYDCKMACELLEQRMHQILYGTQEQGERHDNKTNNRRN